MSKKNPFLFFLPFLILYIVLIIIFATDVFFGDEPRYLSFAENLTRGFYSPPPPEININNGPGYPIVLTPFSALNIPLIYFKLLNAIFLYLAVVFFYKTLLFFVKQKTAKFFAVLFGLYFPLFQKLSLVVTEIFSVFLVTLFVYFFCSFFQKESTKFVDVLVPSFLLAYLALTKIIFGYVISVGIIIFIIHSFIKKSKKIRLTALIFILALSFCIPYLIYTYTLTGKVFCWGHGGGVLYWMSSPYVGEYGDWHNRRLDKSPQLKKNHFEFINSISKLNAVERSDAQIEEAIKNIKQHPKKYFTNWLANIGRILFSYPYSYKPHSLKTYFTIIPNMFIVVFSILCSYITMVSRRKVRQEIFLLLIFISIYLFGSSLVSAGRRMFFLALPVIGLWLAYILDNFVQTKLNTKRS
ncbi:hypothetical protein ACFLT2_09800 [Acidobacteriota bacterium]